MITRARGIFAGLLLCAGIVVAGCGGNGRASTPALPFYADAEMTPRWIATDAPGHAAIHRVGPFKLRDQSGGMFTERDLDGKITVVDFFFTRCPSLCPQLARSMSRIQDSTAASGDVILLSNSVTPEIDSVPVLAAYARHVGAISGKWHLLTGDHTAIYDMARSSYFARLDTGVDAFLHTETFYLLDRSRRIRGIYNGTLDHDVNRLIEDLKSLRNEGA